MNIKEVQEIEDKELSQFDAKGTRTLAGFKKDHIDHVIISLGENESRNTPYIDIRIWTTDRHTGNKIPTKKGIRFFPSEYATLYSIMHDNYNLIANSGIDDPLTPTAGHLQEEILDEVPRYQESEA
tara:strand:- start:290 stop:667 length:378 start_codon:yes stop_codon:yes gene_type:complete